MTPPGRFDILRTIEQLDPERDHQRIVHLSFGEGYRISQLGPPRLVAADMRRSQPER